MPRNKGWHRVYDRHIDSAQIMDLTDSQYRVLMGMWCIASGSDGEIPFSLRQLRRRLFRDENDAEFLEILVDLERKDLIEIESEFKIRVSRWHEHQYDNPSDAPEATRERKQKQRAAAKVDVPETASVDVTSMSRACHDTEKNREEENREDSEERRGEPEREAAAPPAAPGRNEDIEQPGHLLRAAARMLGIAANGRTWEVWRPPAVRMLATATEEQILYALSLKLEEKKGKLFKFEWLEDDLAYLVAQIRGTSAAAADEARRQLVEQRSAQEAQERADAERDRTAAEQAANEERRRKASENLPQAPPGSYTVEGIRGLKREAWTQGMIAFMAQQEKRIEIQPGSS